MHSPAARLRSSCSVGAHTAARVASCSVHHLVQTKCHRAARPCSLRRHAASHRLMPASCARWRRQRWPACQTLRRHRGPCRRTPMRARLLPSHLPCRTSPHRGQAATAVAAAPAPHVLAARQRRRRSPESHALLRPTRRAPNEPPRLPDVETRAEAVAAVARAAAGAARLLRHQTQTAAAAPAAAVAHAPKPATAAEAAAVEVVLRRRGCCERCSLAPAPTLAASDHTRATTVW